MTLDLQTDIAERLKRGPDTRSLAPLLLACRAGQCDKCGDACPIKAARWAIDNAGAITRALAPKAGVPIWRVMVTRDQWVRARDDLAQVSLGAIEKAIRRSLDALRQPSTVAIGIMDAWYGGKQWEAGASLLISGPSKSELFATFPSSSLQVDEVPKLRPAVVNLCRSAHTPKRMPAADADGELPGSKRRGEYYGWLAGLTPTSRIFRYGCDRYFNPLKKTARKVRFTVKRGRPKPVWLAPYQYGSHRDNCGCRICTARRN